jgi:hypothetical protein
MGRPPGWPSAVTCPVKPCLAQASSGGANEAGTWRLPAACCCRPQLAAAPQPTNAFLLHPRKRLPPAPWFAQAGGPLRTIFSVCSSSPAVLPAMPVSPAAAGWLPARPCATRGPRQPGARPCSLLLIRPPSLLPLYLDPAMYPPPHGCALPDLPAPTCHPFGLHITWRGISHRPTSQTRPGAPPF